MSMGDPAIPLQMSFPSAANGRHHGTMVWMALGKAAECCCRWRVSEQESPGLHMIIGR